MAEAAVIDKVWPYLLRLTTILALLQYLVKSVRAEATPKMSFFTKMLHKSHTINSKASKNI